jgi:flagellar basal-body rod protein FlgB
MKQLTASIDSHGKALDLLSQRQKVLAANIANADTPGYQARDFDFSKALAEARGSQGAARAAAPLQWRTPDQPSQDGNTVDLDRERAHFADNATRYEATLRFINHDAKTLLSAISGQQ